MSIESTLEYIHKTKWLGSKPGLSRTALLLEKLGRPDRKLKFVHVAGTNGKGSTCACIASVLNCAGYVTGLYTSPYITCFNERIQVGGAMITDAELEEITNYVRPFADSMTDDPPTEFEMITAVAMEYFARKKCDIVVLEVGMGGLLDSTNVIDPPECAVICAIGLDHTKILGSTVEEIAQAKAGIIKDKTPVAVYDEKQSVLEVFKNACKAHGGTLRCADFSKLSNIKSNLENCTFDYGEYKSLSLGLCGTYQPKNAATAITALLLLREHGWEISDDNIREGLKNVVWKGRFEVLGKNPTFILDGAHNPHGMAATSKSLADVFPNGGIVFLVGAMADKDVDGMMKLLLPLGREFVTVRPDNDRSMSADELCSRLKKLGANAVSCQSVGDGVKTALTKAGKNGVCAALGSLYFSGDVRRAYQKYKDV